MYAFLIGAFVTALGFSLARIDAAKNAAGSIHTKLLVAGSETLRPFMTACADAYVAKHHGIDVIVRGGGSSTGIAAVVAGQIDLALSSREISEEEARSAQSIGGALRIVPIAREAIAVVTHPNVTLDELSMPQLAALLAGTITDWAALDTDGGRVAVIGREPGSGTAAIVEAHVLGGGSLVSTARRLETHEDVISAVQTTPGSIGYTDAQLAARPASAVKTIALRREDKQRVYLPRPEFIASGDYPLTRTLYILTLERKSHPVNALIDYCAGREARHLIQAAGFVPPLAQPLAKSPAVAQR